MRKCPKCGYHDESYWKPAHMHNPSGDVDIARIDDLDVFLPVIAKQLRAARNIVAEDSTFAYLLTRRSVWVKRIDKELFHSGGISAFNQPFEPSGHNRLSRCNTGRNKTTFRKIKEQTHLMVEGEAKTISKEKPK